MTQLVPYLLRKHEALISVSENPYKMSACICNSSARGSQGLIARQSIKIDKLRVW